MAEVQGSRSRQVHGAVGAVIMDRMGAAVRHRNLVIFDLDGTLIDSRLDIANAVNTVLCDLGREARPVEEIVGFIGHGVTRLLERTLGTPQQVAEARELFDRHYGAALLEHTRPYPGVDALVRELAHRWTLAVATNKPGRWAREIVEGLDWADVIRHVVGGGDVARLKPAPDMAEAALAGTGLPRRRAVVVGDMDVDLQFALAAALPFVGVAWGLGGRDHLSAVGSEVVVGDAAELGAALSALGP